MSADLDSPAQEGAVGNPGESGEPRVRGLKIQVLNNVCGIAIVVLVVISAFVIDRLLQTSAQSEYEHVRYNECVNAANELSTASDYLTTQCRMFVTTGHRIYVDAYFDELYNAKRRDSAVVALKLQSEDESAMAALSAALDESNKLVKSELYAMKLTARAIGLSPLPEGLSMVALDLEDMEASNSEKRERAQGIVLGDEYREEKQAISQDVNECVIDLVNDLEMQMAELEQYSNKLIAIQIVLTVLLLCLVATAVISNYVFVTRPLNIFLKNLGENRALDVIGGYEIRRVALSYNRLFEETQQRAKTLEHRAETDPLTGVLNRDPFDRLVEDNEGDIALVIVDVDLFKQINDEYGHEMGDEVLKKVASTLVDSFRNSDYVCRLGGDEFAVIATRVTSGNRKVIEGKLRAISQVLANPADGLPQVFLSFGVAFSDTLPEGESLYREADRALYQSKRNGRNMITFIGDEESSEL